MPSWLNLANKTVVITGAASGIGAELVTAFQSQGCNLFLSDIKLEDIETRIDKLIHKSILGSSNKKLMVGYAESDVRVKAQTIALMAAADRFAQSHNLELPSILVNAAGVTRDGFIQEISEQDYDDVLDTNLKGTFHACQAFCESERVRQLCTTTKAKGGAGGSIINIGSVISERGNIGQTNYAASKGGVVGLTRALAKEMAFQSNRIQRENGSTSTSTHEHKEVHICGSGVIRVNAILPGFIDTPMTRAVPENNRKRILSKIPLNRFGEPADVANMALFLSSGRASYVTGECWECSGAIAI